MVHKKTNLIKMSLMILSLLLIFGCTKTDNNNVLTNLAMNETSLINYTLDEVSNHNTATDCWVVANGNVYNITSFLSKHSAPLENYCGKSTEFENAYYSTHGKSKEKLLAQFKIGILN